SRLEVRSFVGPFHSFGARSTDHVHSEVDRGDKPACQKAVSKPVGQAFLPTQAARQERLPHVVKRLLSGAPFAGLEALPVPIDQGFLPWRSELLLASLHEPL